MVEHRLSDSIKLRFQVELSKANRTGASLASLKFMVEVANRQHGKHCLTFR